MKYKVYTREQLLEVMAGYARMIDRNGGQYPSVVLDDIRKSINAVLATNEYKIKAGS